MMQQPMPGLPVESGSPKYFCYLYIQHPILAYVAFFFIATSVVILIKSCLQYRRIAQTTQSINRIVKLIYYFIFVWCVFYIAKIVTSEIVYWVPIQSNSDSKEQSRVYEQISKYLFALYVVCVFIMQIILILVPYNWMSNVVEIFLRFSQLQDSTQTKKKRSEDYLYFEKTCLRLLRIYLVARSVILVFLVPFLVLNEHDLEYIFMRIILVCLLIEAEILIIIQIMSIVAIRNNNKLIQLVNSSEVRLMVRQYVVIALCMTVRFIIIALFVIKEWSNYEREECRIDRQTEQSWNIEMGEIAIFVVQAILTHYLPIIIVLRMYNVKEIDTELTDSLIAYEQYESINSNPNTNTNTDANANVNVNANANANGNANMDVNMDNDGNRSNQDNNRNGGNRSSNYGDSRDGNSNDNDKVGALQKGSEIAIDGGYL